ncbi:MAG: flagellar biosynthesis anti-sigma factor FlgM [Desulfatitalea sp.]|nr:flagellar biosynthesis anti-sigma factor FlgM [Desulfatitalea sp.]MBI5897296.1 flagellar biosynthesis anti-sigma factor FlgM [Desulfobacterales bacterium]
MEISKNIGPIQRTADATAVQAKDKTVKAAQAAAQGDRVALSAQARELVAAREAIRQMPEVDAQKVAKVRAQLQAGTYVVDSRKIAAKMVAEALLDDLAK